MVAVSNNNLVDDDDLPMFSYRFILGSVRRTHHRDMSGGCLATSPRNVSELYDTTYHNGRRAFDIPDATSLENSDTQITKDHVDRDICFGWCVS